MKKTRRKFMAFLLSAMLLVTGTAMGTSPVSAADKAPPTSITECNEGSFPSTLNLSFADTAWINSVHSISVNGTVYEKKNTVSSSDTNAWCIGIVSGAYGSSTGIKILKANISFPAKIVISADGYSDLTVQVTYKFMSYSAQIIESDTVQKYNIRIAENIENGSVSVDKTSAKSGDTVTITATPATGYTLKSLAATDSNDREVTITNARFEMPASDVTINAVFEKKTADAEKEISIGDIAIKSDSFSSLWQFTFGDSGYLNAVTQVSVNDTPWESYSFTPSMGGKYRIKDGALEFAQNSYGQIPALKSGDVITITADGYKTLTFKVSIANGN